MSGISAMQSGIQGIQQGMSHLKQDAQHIANTQTSLPPHEPMVGLIQDRNQVAASAQVVKAADETLGTLLDVMA